MADLTDPLGALLAQQDDIATRRQLLEAGVTKETIRWRAGRQWRVLLPNVYLMTRAQPTEHQRHVAGLLWAGPAAVLGGPTAARLHGVTAADPGGVVHLDVPPPFASRRRGWAVARRTVLRDPRSVTRNGLRLASPSRSVVDAARQAATEDARAAIVIEAVQRGLVRLDDVAEWVYRLRTRDSAPLHAALDAAASGAWSVPEAAVLSLLATSATLPPAWANPSLTTADGVPLLTPDVWFDDVALAVMVHSRRFHSEGDDWDRTVEKDGELVAHGVVVVGVTPNRIARTPDAVLRRVEAAHVVARGRPRPSVVATPRTVPGVRAS